MKVLIVPDKFKGSLSALQVCEAIGTGLKRGKNTIECFYHPMADGGDGSLDVLINHLDLEAHDMDTIDPLGRKMRSRYYCSSTAAFIELASASGLVLLEKEERNPLKTSTTGTGRMIEDALTKGFKEIYLFIGGSATNDGGMGIASALGCTFLDDKNEMIEANGENLAKIHSVIPSTLFDFKDIEMTLLCDVNNPLFGPDGAAYVYAGQKGANEQQIEYLDNGLRHFAGIIHEEFGMDVSNMPGSGAAGGIWAGLAQFGACLQSGFDTLAELTGLGNKIKSCDWIISGEGKLDSQSTHGKVVNGIAELCRRYGKPLSLFVGKNELSVKDLSKLDIKGIYSITEIAKSREDAMKNSHSYLKEMGRRFSTKLN